MQFRMGPWLILPDMNVIAGDGEPCHISPKAMEVLTCLAERQGQVVGKDEILQEVWKGTFVSDDSLTRCVVELRRAFGDDARQPEIIKTIPKRGYLLLSPVAFDQNGASPQAASCDLAGTEPDVATEVYGEQAPSESRPGLWNRRVAPAALVVTVLGAVLLALSATVWHGRSGDRQSISRLAVLPLANLSGNPELDHFAESMTDQLIVELGQYSAWEVIPSKSVMRFKGSRQPLHEIARDLAVDRLIEGTVVESGDRVHYTVQLTGAASDTPLWSGSFEHGRENAVLQQADIARTIAGKVKHAQSPQEPGQSGVAREVVPQAKEAYLRGWYFFNRAQFSTASSYFFEATLADPGFALAYALLAESDGMAAFNIDQPPSDRCLQAIARARQLDDNMAEVRDLVGDSLFANWDWQAGETEYRRAVELDPNSVDAAMHYVCALHILTRWQAAEQEVQRALRVDPVSIRLNFEKLRLLIDTHRYGQALEQFQKLIELDPYHPLAYAEIAGVYQALGREDDAIKALLKADALWSNMPVAPEPLATAARQGGIRGHLRKLFESLRQMGHPHAKSPTFLAAYSLQLGDIEAAMRYLEIAFRERRPQLMWVKARANWDPLRSDPRFQSLLARMRFPE
jgi:DNA-binding winged helix-turn-helix (wHTH) protein/TolB-like protein/tetratricopeptide (TPR) repeat protein